ncbi:hypothetical protein Hdeb2414_s0008g00287431 [Helianthus debilis subsp. tardiflorus]
MFLGTVQVSKFPSPTPATHSVFSHFIPFSLCLSRLNEEDEEDSGEAVAPTIALNRKP